MKVAFIPEDLGSRLPDEVWLKINSNLALTDTLRVVVQEIVRSGEGWAVGTIFVRRYVVDQEAIRESCQFNPPNHAK